MTATSPQTSHADSISQPVRSPRQVAGMIVSRLIVPAWLMAGAIAKLVSMNPKLLPPPVLAVVEWAAQLLQQPVTEVYEPALRVIVMGEITLALAMAFAPRLSRVIAAMVLTLFCVILIVALSSGAKDCGCFGKGGPPPWAMLLIDATLLLAVLALPLPRCNKSVSGTVGACVAALVFGTAVAWSAPGIGTTVIEPGPAVDPAGSTQPTPPITTPPATTPPATTPPSTTPPSTTPPAPPIQPTNPPVVDTPPNAAVAPWPAPPATAKPYYDADFKSWIGKRLDQQELPLLIQQPLPINPNKGRLHIVFMREDCEHCHALLTKFFSNPTLQTPALTVIVPDASGAPMPNPCTACQTATLIKGGIIWMFTTPALITVQDGVVVGACDASEAENDDAVRAALNAGT